MTSAAQLLGHTGVTLRKVEKQVLNFFHCKRSGYMYILPVKQYCCWFCVNDFLNSLAAGEVGEDEEDMYDDDVD